LKWPDRWAVDTLLVHDHHSSPNILIQVQTLHVSVVSVFVDSFFLLFVWLQNILCLIVYFELRPYFIFLCPRHSKNGGGALSVTPVRASVRASVCASVRPLSKFGVRSITFERLHWFNSNLVCWYIISKHRSSSIWVKIH